MSCVDYTWLTERITKTKALIVAYEDAITALIANPTRSYTLDTGQSTQTANYFDIKKLEEALLSLENRLATLCARRDGAALTIRASW